VPYTGVISRHTDDGLELSNGEREVVEIYLEDAGWTYRSLEEGVKTRLVNLAINARNTMENDVYQRPWVPFCFLLSIGLS
jgi:hypothetical protein